MEQAWLRSGAVRPKMRATWKHPPVTKVRNGQRNPSRVAISKPGSPPVPQGCCHEGRRGAEKDGTVPPFPCFTQNFNCAMWRF